ncbi:MAG: hypothetical protein R3E87_19530 [Burkholderiaceae bacterium]
MLVGTFLPTALLILLSAALGFLVAWNWRGRHFRGLARQNMRLRRHRKRLRQIHDQDQARLDSAQTNQRIAEEELVMINQAHAALEAEHAKLVTRHANLTRLVRKRLGRGDSGGDGETTEPAEAGQADTEEYSARALHQPAMPPTAATGSMRHPDPREAPTASPGEAVEATRDPIHETSTGLGPGAAARPEPIATNEADELGQASTPRPLKDHDRTAARWLADTETRPGTAAGADDEGTIESADLSPIEDLERFSEQLATAPANLVGGPESLSAPDTFPTTDDALAEDEPWMDSEPAEHADEDTELANSAAELEALRVVLDAREDEIKSLREQLAPLLGLPLAVSTREAERDRLARRLLEREQQIADLQARLHEDLNPSRLQSSAADVEDEPPPAARSAPAQREQSAVARLMATRDEGRRARGQGGTDRSFERAASAERAAAPDRGGRLAEMPPILHSEVPLDDLLNDIRSLDRSERATRELAKPGRARPSAGRPDDAEAGPSTDEGSDDAEAGPSTDEGADDAEAKPSTDEVFDDAEVGPSTGQVSDDVEPGATADEGSDDMVSSTIGAARGESIETGQDNDDVAAKPDATRDVEEPDQTGETRQAFDPEVLEEAVRNDDDPDQALQGDADQADAVEADRERPEQDMDRLVGDAWPDPAAVRAWQATQGNDGQAQGDATRETAAMIDQTAPGVPRQYSLAPDRVDDLKRIVGIGPVIERMLNRLGVFQLRQIAAWNDDDVAFFDSQLDEFRGRIDRDRWVEQARELL